MPELSPHLQEIQDRFLTNYGNGGLDACRDMVADLAQEAELAKAVSGGTSDLDSETIQLQDVLPADEVDDRMELTRGIHRDALRALSRYSFALFLLQTVEGPSEDHSA